MKGIHLLALLGFLGVVTANPLAVKAADVGSTLVVNAPAVEAKPTGNADLPRPALAQVIESPSVPSSEAPAESSTSLIIESPGASSSSKNSFSETTTNLVIESPGANVSDSEITLEAVQTKLASVGQNSPALPSQVAQASESSARRIEQEKQNRAQYQEAQAAAAVASSSVDAPQVAPRPNSTPLVIESPSVSDKGDVELLVIDSFQDVASEQEPIAEIALTQKVELKELSFQCGASDGIPTTIAKLKDSDKLIVVLWSSDFFKAAGYDAQMRCEQVSARFAEFVKSNPSSYLTVGEINKQSVVCITTKEDGACGEGITLFDGLLFTLNPADDSQQILKDLAAILQSKTASDLKPLEQ